ncbi:MAG: exodeoxyribonuclease V subunit alpha [Candidatus Binatia bacterium]|nr:exodeoxyribonuclease V subunit alpha [Candidatus Binatia bacterium]
MNFSDTDQEKAATESREEFILPSGCSDFDRRFAATLQAFENQPRPEVFAAAALASAATAQGRICVALAEFAEERGWVGPEAELLVAERWQAPPLDHWTKVLRESDVVGEPGSFHPLILDAEGRLYLQRYWRYEHQLASRLHEMSRGEVPRVATADILQSLTEIEERGMQLAVGQRAAVATALLRQLTVIAGGAGTGKTTIVACILRLMGEHCGSPGFRVRLAAPTGKAANRLAEQLHHARNTIDPDGRIDTILDQEPATLHRLLGGAPNGVHFRHDRQNPLPLDVLVVDESSMVDAALMAKVVEAMPAQSRLILVGDPEQLPPVEVGSVFGELVGDGANFSAAGANLLEEATGVPVPPVPPQPGRPGAPVRDCVILLDESFRFSTDSGIAALADALREGNAPRTFAVLDGDYADIEGIGDGEQMDAEARRRIRRGYQPFVEALAAGADPRDVLQAAADFRVLAVRREGAHGVVALNEMIEGELRAHGGLPPAAPWYAGRLVMVTRNNRTLRLFNGDIGVALPDADGRLKVFFEGSGQLRQVAPGRLSHVETVFAMTVHKSQGSEYRETCLVLPETPSRLLTRELLYTAVTRARTHLLLAGPRDRFAEGLARRLPRSSVLAEVIRGLENKAEKESV